MVNVGLLERKTFFILSGLLVLAALFRLLGISDRVLWYDELYSVSFAIQPLADLLQSVREYDPHPPLYYLQLHFWLKLGTGEVWLRLNSVLWSLLAVFPTYFVGRRLFGEAGGFWAALVLVVSPVGIFYAHEVRMYAVQMSLVALNLLLLERLLAGEQRRFELLFFFFTLVAICHVQGAGFLLLLPITVYALQRLKWNLRLGLARQLIFMIFLAGVCALPWLIQAQGTSLSHLRLLSFEDVPTVILKLLLGPDVEGGSSLVLLLFLGLAFVTLVGLILTPRTRDLAIAYILVTFSFTLLLAYFVSPVWHIKALAGILPILSIIVGGALAAVFERFGRTKRVGVGLTVAVVLCLGPYAVSVNSENDFRRMHYDTAEYLLVESQPGDTIEVEDWRDFWTLSWYLAGPGSVKIDTVDRPVIFSGGRQLLKMAENGISVSGNWRVERNDNWPDVAEPNPQEAQEIAHFARMVVYRQP